MIQLQPGQRIHMIGIGGAGLSAIARVLLERGFAVTGSDLKANAFTAALAADGARIDIGHEARYVQGADIVLATSAAPADHVEIAAARALSVPVFNRRDFIRLVLRDTDTIAVAGTHGKTTTTSMIIHILRFAGEDPSYIVGGALAGSGANAGVGAGPSFVIEADEYDNMFHGVQADLAVITNIEHDHPDFFKSRRQLTDAFRIFVDGIKPGGELVVCADDEAALALAAKWRAGGGRATTYGIECSAADWRARNLKYSREMAIAKVARAGLPGLELRLGPPGAHNMLNALAALIVADKRGVRPQAAVAALASFQSTARRFEIRGEREGVIVIDDYAHHPTEIRVNIEAARLRYPERQIWAIWQPHTYSRVQQFWAQFIEAFAGADAVLVTPIYAAREGPIDGISSAALAQAIAREAPAAFAPTFDAAVEMLRRLAQAPAVALIFSAGDANQIADLYLGSEA